jgi:hypothetical protein
MNAKEFYDSLRQTNFRVPQDQLAATQEELARSAPEKGVVSTSPWENIIGKLEQATSFIGQLLNALAAAKAIIGHGNTPPTQAQVAEFDRQLLAMGVQPVAQPANDPAQTDINAPESVGRPIVSPTPQGSPTRRAADAVNNTTTKT